MLENKTIGPTIPVDFFCNSQSPEAKQKKTINTNKIQMELPEDEISSSSNIEILHKQKKIIGPAWPSFSQDTSKIMENKQNEDAEDDDVIGPQLPKSEEEQQNDYLFRLNKLKEEKISV